MDSFEAIRVAAEQLHHQVARGTAPKKPLELIDAAMPGADLATMPGTDMATTTPDMAMPMGCSLQVTVTTASPGGKYSPRNIGAIWISDGSDRFIKTLNVWADRRAKYLKRWNAATSAAGASETGRGTAIASPGHTVGHHCYAISSGNRVVVNTGDLAHHQVLLLRRPLLEFAFDTDPKQSAQTRARLLDRIATDRHAVLSYHFPWPGLGNVVKEGSGFGWFPSPINVTAVE